MFVDLNLLNLLVVFTLPFSFSVLRQRWTDEYWRSSLRPFSFIREKYLVRGTNTYRYVIIRGFLARLPFPFSSELRRYPPSSSTGGVISHHYLVFVIVNVRCHHWQWLVCVNYRLRLRGFWYAYRSISVRRWAWQQFLLRFECNWFYTPLRGNGTLRSCFVRVDFFKNSRKLCSILTKASISRVSSSLGLI